MGIAESLKSLGVSIEDTRSVVEGIDRLIISREYKLKLLREFATERGIKITPELEALLHE